MEAPSLFSSSRVMSVPSDSLRSTAKQMTGPKETYSSLCISVLFGNIRPEQHRRYKQKHNAIHLDKQDAFVAPSSVDAVKEFAMGS